MAGYAWRGFGSRTSAADRRARGFGTFVGVDLVEPEIAWAKLGSLVEGAQLASAELW